jgi:hypothetical protein
LTIAELSSNFVHTMSKSDVIAKLDAQVREAGGIRAWSRNHPGFSASFISAVLVGKNEPSKNLLALLGYEVVREVKYRPISAAA